MANNFKSYGLSNISANTVVYTVPVATQTTAIGLVVANKTLGTVTANAQIIRASNTYFLIQNATIVSGTSLVLIGGDQKVVLQANDSVSISSSANTDTWISVLEIS
jgi:hypothetical protein